MELRVADIKGLRHLLQEVNILIISIDIRFNIFQTAKDSSPTAAPIDAKSVDTLQNLGEVIQSVLDSTSVPKSLTVEGAEKYAVSILANPNALD